MNDSDRHSYEFGPFRLDASDRLLMRGTEVIPLSPKAVDTLVALIANRGHVLDKGELMKIVWPDTFVEEGGLSRNISLLRKALGDGPDDCQYIETIPKRGYRFVAPVREVNGETAPPAGEDRQPEVPREGQAHKPWWRSRRWLWIAAGLSAVILAVLAYLWPRTTVTVRRKQTWAHSIAVLPLDNLSRDPAQDYFSEGMTEVLITDLARIENLRVISRTSVMRYQGQRKRLEDIAHDLKVDTIVEGAVLAFNGKVRITAKLVDTKTGGSLWAGTYERDLRDVLSLQSEVAESIAQEIQVKLSPEQQARQARTRQVDPEAFRAYLKGRYFWNRRTEESLRRAVDYFRDAISKDPGYALPYAGLADSYSLLGSTGYDAIPPRTAMPLAKAAAKRALEIDGDLAEGHASLAYVKLSYDWNLPGAEKEFQRAIALNPGLATAHHWYAHYFIASGDFNNALAQMEKARELDPLSLVINVGIGWCYYYSQQDDLAIEQFRKTLELDPAFALTHQTLGMSY